MCGGGGWPVLMQEIVENALLDVDPKDIHRDLLLRTTKALLEDTENDTTLLFKNLLRSFRGHLDLHR